MSNNTITLYNGDCQKLITEKEFADLICTDPPYKLTTGGKSDELSGCLNRLTYGNDGLIVPCDITWKEIMIHCFNALKPNRHAYIMTNDRNMEEALFEARQVGFKFHNILVWDKETVTPNKYYMHRIEFCLFLYKGKTKNIKDMGISNLFRVYNKKGNGHPTEKPIELMKTWIEQSTNINDTVYDPFMGIGTTGIAANEIDRNFIGCDIYKEYFDIAKDRIENNNLLSDLF